jgi:hypothetical protein
MSDLHAFSVIPYRQGLVALSGVLGKAAAHAAAAKIEPRALLDARLFPDMFPLTGQVQVACDHAKRGVARLLGIEAPKHEDTEASFEELQARIASTLAFVEANGTRERFAGRENAAIELRLGGETRRYTPIDYLTWFSLPNFYFHLTTAYDLLRHNGVPLGKRDFLGARPQTADA